MRYADAAIIDPNPETLSGSRTPTASSGCLIPQTVKAERGERIDKHLLITRGRIRRAPPAVTSSIDDVLEILSRPFLGIIPESKEVLLGSNVGSPVTLNNAMLSAPARAYFDAARRLKG